MYIIESIVYSPLCIECPVHSINFREKDDIQGTIAFAGGVVCSRDMESKYEKQISINWF